MKRTILCVAAAMAAVAGAAEPESPQPQKKKPDVVYVPTPHAVVDKMLEMAEIKPGDVLYDLGCGDGRIVVAAAKRFGIKAVGFDIDPLRVKESLANVKSNGVEHLVTIKQEDVFTQDLSEASVVTMYLLPNLNVRLMPQLEKLKPGSRVLSHDFQMRGAKPLVVHTMDADVDEGFEDFAGFDHTIYKWLIPWEKEPVPPEEAGAAADVWRAEPRDKDATRVTVVTGGHDHDTSFYSVFEGYPDIAATVRAHPAAFARDLRKQTDVLVLYDMVREIDPKQQEVLKQFVEAGKGVVVLHHAVADYLNWPWWSEEVVGSRYVFEAPPGGIPSSYAHDEILAVSPVGSHPVIGDIGAFQILDETYKNMWYSLKIQVLFKTDNPTSDGPVAWIGPCATSRVVGIQLGHDRNAHLNPAYRKLVRNAVVWAASKAPAAKKP